jgi:peptide/nickel transport system substrate-binding protein
VADAPAHVRVVTTPSQSTSVLTFSSKSALTADPRLRKAVSLAVDRSALVTSVYDGHAEVAKGLLPGNQPGAEACTSCQWSTHDVHLAEKDLATVPGHRHLTLLVDSADVTDVHTAQAIAPMLAQAGVSVRTLPLTAAAMTGRLSSGDYEMALQTLSADSPSAAEPLQALVTGHYLAGPTAVATAQDALRSVDSAAKTPELTSAVTAFEQQVFATTAAVPLVDPDVVDLVAAPVRGLVVSPTGLYHSAELWLKS